MRIFSKQQNFSKMTMHVTCGNYDGERNYIELRTDNEFTVGIHTPHSGPRDLANEVHNYHGAWSNKYADETIDVVIDTKQNAGQGVYARLQHMTELAFPKCKFAINVVYGDCKPLPTWFDVTEP